MRRYLFISVLSLIGLISFYSCNTECGSPPPVPLIQVDNNIQEGDYMVLEARGSDEHVYTWRGPNGEEEAGRFWEFGKVQRANSGEYSVEVDDGVCDGIINYRNIQIDPLPLPCPNTQLSLIVTSTSSIEFSNIEVQNYIDTISGDFRIRITGNEGSLLIKFFTDEIPYYDRSYGMYGIEGYQEFDMVKVELYMNSNGLTYEQGNTGYLYVRDRGNYDFDIYLCDLPLYGEGEILQVRLFEICNIQ